MGKTSGTAGTGMVTGATHGIGRAAALRLARDGWDVIVHGRNAGRGAEVVKAIEAEGGLARFIAADLSDIGEVRRLAEEVGEVEVLVNNAGTSWFGPTADLDVAEYDTLFDGNVRSAYFLGAALAPAMANRGRGSIINLGSMAGTIGLVGAAAYGATKAAMASMARSWAAEFSPQGVRVNTVAPGGVHQPGKVRYQRRCRQGLTAGKERPGRRDRRGYLLPRLGQSQLLDRRGPRCRRRAHGHLAP